MVVAETRKPGTKAAIDIYFDPLARIVLALTSTIVRRDTISLTAIAPSLSRPSES
ncbi:MAG: hypothetical protein ABDH32_07650 [Candidatus Caldarchaeales archaeon]